MTTRNLRTLAAMLSLGLAGVVGVGACAPMPVDPGTGTTTSTSTTVDPGPTSTTSSTTSSTSTTTSTSTTSTTTTTSTTSTTTTTVPPLPTINVPSASPVAVSVSGNPGVANVTVNWSGQPANKLIFVDLCVKSNADATFNAALDCAPLSELNINGTASGSGSTTFEVFRGVEPSGDLSWGCFAAGDTAPAGILKATTCYVRVTNTVLSNKNDATEAPFTIS
jgi:hypothetical protein